MAKIYIPRQLREGIPRGSNGLLGWAAYRAGIGPALVAAALFTALAAALIAAHDGQVSALMMLPQESACYEARQAPPGVAVFPDVGYDGHLFYYIARDLTMADPCADAYRYQRIVYPALIWLFSLGQVGAMPLMMTVINILAIAGGTLIMAAWLAHRDHRPWWALVYALSLGHVLVVQYALSGAVALTLAVWAAYLILQRDRPYWSVALFALALLTRETTGLIWAPIVAYLAYRRRWSEAAVIAGAIVPYFIWEGVLWARFGRLPLTGTNAAAVTWFQGIIWLVSHLEFTSGWRQALRSASALPYLAFTLACLVVSGSRLFKTGRAKPDLWAWLTLFNAGCILFLGRGMWEYVSSIGRVSLTLVPCSLMLALDSQRLTRYLILGGLGGLFILGLARLYLAGVHTFFIQAG